MTVRRLALTLLCLVALTANAGDGHFAIIGDVPYNAAERALLPRMLADIAAEGADFIVHVGDFKSGQTVCSDALFADRQALFAASPVPLIYVPGDNEWTDCARTSNGAYDPLERLAHLRALFFDAPETPALARLHIERQSAAWPEHQRWRYGDVLLLTLNVPGGNNWGQKSTPSPEFVTRMQAVSEWLADSLEVARTQQLRGIVILMQANPDFRRFTSGSVNRAFQPLLAQIADASRRFPGTVLVAHGDTHHARFDQPIRALPRLFRAEPPGSPFMGWIQVTAPNREPETKKGALLSARVRWWAPASAP